MLVLCYGINSFVPSLIDEVITIFFLKIWVICLLRRNFSFPSIGNPDLHNVYRFPVVLVVVVGHHDAVPSPRPVLVVVRVVIVLVVLEQLVGHHEVVVTHLDPNHVLRVRGNDGPGRVGSGEEEEEGKKKEGEEEKTTTITC